MAPEEGVRLHEHYPAPAGAFVFANDAGRIPSDCQERADAAPWEQTGTKSGVITECGDTSWRPIRRGDCIF